MISIGDKVVCIYAFKNRPSFEAPNGVPSKGQVYTVCGFHIDSYERLGIKIVGVPAYNEGVEVGWGGTRFRKLEDYKAEQELAYYRTQPTKVHA